MRKGYFMENINYYIAKSATMPNTSDGGSPSYCFDDVVLVKYTNYVKYGEARENEEQIATIVNQKNEEGVRTPKHLAIKREIVGDTSICWVLQERAKGESFAAYCQPYSPLISQQLENQFLLASAPSEHYEKFIRDVSSIFHMGLELKPKNLFYDKDVVHGGFTIIDLLFADGTPLDVTSLKEVLSLLSTIQGIYNSSYLSSYNRHATEEQVELSFRLRCKIKLRMLNALQKVIPCFEEHRRWILRTCSSEELDFFTKNGFPVEDLSLSAQECEQFDNRIQSIVDACLSKISRGEVEYWQVLANEIRIALDSWGMQAAWRYHKGNVRNIDEFEDAYDYKSACEKDLENAVIQKFQEKLLSMEGYTENPHLLEALHVYEEDAKKKK